MNSHLLQLVENYKTPDKAVELVNKTPVVFLVGISGAGKDTILKELLKNEEYKLVVSHTTRLPRENHGILEKNGREYYFISQEEAARMLENQEFIEAKQYSGNVYGTSIFEVEEAFRHRKIAISDIEVQGISEYMRVSPKVIPIFVLPPDFDTWQRRLKDRYKAGANLEDIKKRLEAARTELHEALSRDYFQYVVNKDLNETVKIVDEIAHGNFSTDKNQQAKEVASALLQKI
jgi:guanylate kinase